MPSLRQLTALVTAMGGRAWTSSLCDSCVMYLQMYVSNRSLAARYQLAGPILLQYLGLGCLGISKVHHLVEEFVDDDEVVPDTLLL